METFWRAEQTPGEFVELEKLPLGEKIAFTGSGMSFIHIPVQELGLFPGSPQSFCMRGAAVLIDTARRSGK